MLIPRLLPLRYDLIYCVDVVIRRRASGLDVRCLLLEQPYCQRNILVGFHASKRFIWTIQLPFPLHDLFPRARIDFIQILSEQGLGIRKRQVTLPIIHQDRLPIDSKERMGPSPLLQFFQASLDPVAPLHRSFPNDRQQDGSDLLQDSSSFMWESAFHFRSTLFVFQGLSSTRTRFEELL